MAHQIEWLNKLTGSLLNGSPNWMAHRIEGLTNDWMAHQWLNGSPMIEWLTNDWMAHQWLNGLPIVTAYYWMAYQIEWLVTRMNSNVIGYLQSDLSTNRAV